VRNLVVATLMLFLAMLGAAQKTTPRSAPSAEAQRHAEQFREDQKAIAQLQQREIEANIAFDVQKLVTLYAEDVVLLPPGQAPIKGLDALHSYYAEAQKELGNTEILGYEETWDEVQISGEWAYQWGTITERTQAASGAKEITTTVHAMRILHRQPSGDWLIARAIWNPAPQAAPATPPK